MDGGCLCRALICKKSTVDEVFVHCTNFCALIRTNTEKLDQYPVESACCSSKYRLRSATTNFKPRPTRPARPTARHPAPRRTDHEHSKTSTVVRP
ncbi:hypothetical protein Tharo_2470 [Thauera aromatica K172]|uniref:Uncharacterized protein n=1 Tax=Thauera aromatica K172 TaxID=44139 RepID=A0A2R4BPV0_THAAR|nr:hypothetical protein Tharo_2470 [Thauera aromatica K172]